MTATRDAIVAPQAGGGTAGTAVARFCNKGAAVMPTSATAVLDPVNFHDAGWCTQDGLKKAISESSNEIKGFGNLAPLRIIITESKCTFDVTFLESNPTVVALYNRLTLGSLVPDGSGNFDFVEGPVRQPEYGVVFDLIDGANIIRAVCPDIQVTGRGDFAGKMGDPAQYPMTVTAYPGADGTAVHWYYTVPAAVGL